MEGFIGKKNLHPPLRLKKKKKNFTNLRSKKTKTKQNKKTLMPEKIFNLTPESSREMVILK